MSHDNWNYRSLGMLCRNCFVWVPKERTEFSREAAMKQVLSNDLSETCSPGEALPKVVGRCRRHAPTLSGWPVVYSDDWCGDFKLDENKI